MFGKINRSSNIYWALSYNEQKLNAGKAECLLAENFVKDLDQLTRQDKLDRFHQRISLNERVIVNAIQISVNFGHDENIDNELMKTMARRYMDAIGFEHQPYLVYRHHDSAHPHLHIVTTPIQADGTRVNMGPAHIRESHRVTRQLEQEYSLARSTKAGQEDEVRFSVKNAQRVIYGEKPLKNSISDVLHTVVEQYKYTNLRELNAVLQLYNVKASRGEESSQVYQHRGLLYHAIDKEGKNVGKSLKASSFLFKPTLVNLEKKFALNETQRAELSERTQGIIDWTLAGRAPDWNGFREAMERDRISVVVLAEKKGGPEEIFFVDHITRSVFEGKTLGDKYLLETIRQRCSPEQPPRDDEDTLRQRLHLGL
ncbi:MAG TPA: relaxase/mobilization nuclease domain-containing protein [Puia sp.]|jgi:hypothetical protein